FVNFLLALIIYILASFAYGDTDISASSLKDGFAIENPILTNIGFKTGDKVLKVDGEPVTYESDIRRNIIGASNVTIERGGVEKTIELPIDFLGQLSSSDDRTLFGLRQPFIVEKVMDTSLNKSVDLQKGDIFKSINGKPAEYFDQIVPILEETKGQTVTATIKRGNTTINRKLKVDQYAKLDILTERSMKQYEELGYLKIITKNYSFGESFGVGFNKFTSQIGSYFGQLKAIFNPKTGAYKGVGGFKAIYDIFPDTWSWPAFWGLTAFLSIMLGVLNLLPIPALDGGHVMFLLYEMISGRKPGEKFLEKAQMVGFFILIALVLFANGNDIVKAIFN
ncbi:MAG TPA: RIP metalloprotease RseP, partial [Flavobacteriaceae bacterium]|nr:RIP metalloprotease RseP [Flavobacteriaceae bacterium]